MQVGADRLPMDPARTLPGQVCRRYRIHGCSLPEENRALASPHLIFATVTVSDRQKNFLAPPRLAIVRIGVFPQCLYKAGGFWSSGVSAFCPAISIKMPSGCVSRKRRAQEESGIHLQ